MKIAFGCDKNGLNYKNRLVEYAKKIKGVEIVDMGTYEYVPCDSPYYAAKVAKSVASGECDYGVLLCATGSGMVIAANKIKGAMCALGYSDEVVRLMREHNAANIIAFGQDHMGYKDVEKRFEIFINTGFSGLRHQAYRIQQIKQLEEGEEIYLAPIFNSNWDKQHVYRNH